MEEAPLRVLCIHGIGHQLKESAWQRDWREAIEAGIRRWNANREVTCEYLEFEALFAQAPIRPALVANALLQLGWSGISAPWRGESRAWTSKISEVLRWTAGMVAQWASDADLRRQSREQLLEAVEAFAPEVICAHSLGSLVAYDTFRPMKNSSAISERVLISFGSQIGNPFVRNVVGGRIEALPARCWYFLYNRFDRVFTTPLSVMAESFVFLETDFETAGFLHHDAIEYLRHSNTVYRVWRELAQPRCAPSPGPIRRPRRPPLRSPSRRAFLVGIDEYSNGHPLEGCANDVYLMSSLLQEAGFAPDQIRVVLNGRATCEGILDRLEWLLDSATPGDMRVFYFSGHGAQIPVYGPTQALDHIDECLVPVDFDWTRERAITDQQFFNWYSQLPYEMNFLTILDCCHSGGMTRAGGFQVRGIDPPDDIRHRQMQWNAREQMWESRPLPLINPDSAGWKRKTPVDQIALLGESGAKWRLGRAARLRTLPDREYDRARRLFGHKGPYLPVILQACEEDEYAFEYKHGLVAYGAFTFALASVFRAQRAVNWSRWTDETAHKLRRLAYRQHPVLVCPPEKRMARTFLSPPK